VNDGRTVGELLSLLNSQKPGHELSALLAWMSQRAEARKPYQVLAAEPPVPLPEGDEFARWAASVEAAMWELPKGTQIAVHPDLTNRLRDRLRRECQKLLDARQSNDYPGALLQAHAVVRLHKLVQQVEKVSGSTES